MPIQDRNLKPGTKLMARYHKQTYTCAVVEGEGGKIIYRLEDGKEFKSPSAAGMAITGKSCNGWAFWSLAPAESTAAGSSEIAIPRTEATPVEPSEQTAPAKKRIFPCPTRRVPPKVKSAGIATNAPRASW